MLKTQYSLLRTEKQFEPFTPPTVVYGIRADISGETVYEIEDFTLSEDYASEVIALLKKEDPEKVHIAEIIEDFLS